MLRCIDNKGCITQKETQQKSITPVCSIYAHMYGVDMSQKSAYKSRPKSQKRPTNY